MVQALPPNGPYHPLHIRPLLRRSWHAKDFLNAVGVGRKSFRQDLDGNLAAELGVGRTPDFAHAALAEFGGNAVMSNGLLWAHWARFQA
jgi:hypothetical protein